MGDEKTAANVRVRMLPFGRTAQKRARVSIASLRLGNQRRVAAVTARGGRWKARDHSGNGLTGPARQFVLELGHYCGLDTVP